MVTWGPTTVFGGAAGAGATPGAGGTTTGAPATPGGATGFSFGGAPANTGTPAPGPGGGLFGTAQAPATGGLFGGSTAPSAGGGLFGGAPAPATGGGLFGSTTQAAAPPGGGLFGSAPAPGGGGLFGSSTPGGLFGSPASAPSGGGLFGSSTPTSGGGLFGTTPTYGAPQQQQQQSLFLQQQQQGPVMDARDVYQAFLANNAKKEEIRITEAMRNIYEIYTGTKQQLPSQQQTSAIRSDENTSVPFTTILYNPATGQQRQLMAVHAAGGTGGGTANAAMVAASIVEKPIQISQSDWNEAIVQNPDVMNYVPIGIIGADALQARVLWHQEQVNLIAKHMESIELTHTTLRQRYTTAVRLYENQKYNHTRQRIRLLELMKKVELLRCWNQPLQIAELEAATKLRTMKQQVEHIRHGITSIQSLAASHNNNYDTSSSYSNQRQPLLQLTYDGSGDNGYNNNDNNALVISSSVPSYVPDETKLLEIVKQHRSQLAKYTMDLKKDKHDLQLIEQRVRSQTPVPATFRS